MKDGFKLTTRNSGYTREEEHQRASKDEVHAEWSFILIWKILELSAKFSNYAFYNLIMINSNENKSFII